MYDFEIDRVVGIIRENNYRTVGLQFPEGLKEHAPEVVDEINKKVDCSIIISADPCHGACDLADGDMELIGVEALFHFGHSKILKKTGIPVFYIEARSDVDPISSLSEHLEKLPKRVGLVTTIQHVHTLNKVKRFLEDKGFEVHIGKAKGRAKYDGQVLGCNFACAKEISELVDGFIYTGTGNFHPLGVALATRKKTFAFDLLLNEVRDMEDFKDRILKQRFAQIEKAMNAETFGIIVGEKRGQARKNLALKIKRKLEVHGKKAYLIYLNEIDPGTLMPFRKLNAFVNTACPRVTIDEAKRYKQALLTPNELDIMLGEERWENYRMDEIP